MPRRTMASESAPWIGRPPKLIVPALGTSRPDTVRSTVVLPAPFAPMRATSSPSFTSRQTESSTRVLPRWSVTLLSDSIGLLYAEVRLDDPPVGAHLGGPALGDRLAVVEDHDAVGDVHHHVHVVLDEHDGEAPGAQLGDEPHDVLALLAVHPGGRLVEQQHLRLGCERLRNLEQALVAVGELLGAQMHLGPRPTLRSASRARASGSESPRASAPASTPSITASGPNTSVFWKVRTTPSCAMRKGAGRDGVALNKTSRAPGAPPGDDVEERGLARTVGADDAQHFARGHGEIHTLQRRQAAEAYRDALGPQGARSWLFLRRSRHKVLDQRKDDAPRHEQRRHDQDRGEDDHAPVRGLAQQLGQEREDTAPSTGPISVPLPPRITMISMMVIYEKLKRSGLTKPT